MVDKSSILQIIGSLMKQPNLLSQSDKINLTLNDFSNRLDKFIFAAIENLYRNGANKIAPIDIENYFETIQNAKILFEKENGIEYLQDAYFLSEPDNFDYYYNRLKKFNLLKSLNTIGIDTKQFYNENLLDEKAIDINKKFEELTIKDIVDSVKKDLLKVEREFESNESTETQSAALNIEDIITDAYNSSDVGLPLQGTIFNKIVSGARKGCLYIRSAPSSVGKTRLSVADACYLAFPFRYSYQNQKWIQTGNSKRVLFIATEQNFKEIQKMILAYLTGINESKFRYGKFTEEETLIIKQAIRIIELYKSNFYIVRMPNPTIELVKTIVRENCLSKDIEYVFYDYIFIGPSLLQEFKGFNLRNDELLLLLATALKDLAVELNIFIMTSTQVNSNVDDNKNIRNEGSLAGGRSTINKADVGVIMSRPTKDELDIFVKDNVKLDIIPNIVTDVYKVRSGQWTQVRIWSYIDLGILKREDLFVTDSRLQEIKDFYVEDYTIKDWTNDEYQIIMNNLSYINNMKE